MEARGARERDLENTERVLKRVRERTDTLSKSVRTLERCIMELCERQIIQPPLTPSSNTRRSSKHELETLLEASDQLVQSLVEWASNTLPECLAESAHRLNQLKDELKHRD